jgi:YVTN family beta-propeller protein
MRNAALGWVVLVAGCGGGEPQPQLFASNCTVDAPPVEAALPPGHLDDRSAILPGGRKVTPSGTLLDIGGYPIALRILPGDRYAVVTDDAVKDQALLLVDLAAADPQKPIVSSHAYPIGAGGDHAPGLFYGLALAKNGQRIYVSNGGYDAVDDNQPLASHYNTVEVYDLMGAPPILVRNDALTIKLLFSKSGNSFVQRLPSGLQLSADEQLLYVANQSDNSLAIVDLANGPTYGAEIATAALPGLAPYDVAVDDASHTAFVSLWGGMKQGMGYVDGVVPVDVSNPRAPIAAAAPIATGKAAEAELLLAGKLYVANADGDTLSVVDTASRTIRTMPVTTSMILGASPNNLAIDPGSNGNPGRIYVANANENSVSVLDLASLAVIGQIPTAWYPTAVGVRSDGGVVIASARGLGYGPFDGNGYSERVAGLLQVMPRPDDATLKNGSQIVADNLDRPRALQAKVQCPPDATPATSSFPLPVAPGSPSPLKYVFFIVRENKTYDSLFGDLGIGNGDPSLMEWTDDVIPNARDLAKRFVLLDNFYSHAELSLQGHEWTTGCIANDYVEKGWGATEDYGRGYRPDTAFTATSLGRLGYPGSDSIWVHLDKAGVAYHNYGEITNLLGAKTIFDPSFPGVYFNTSILDVTKVQYVIDNVLSSGDSLEPFNYILLPNDHTSATKTGSMQPQSMMADNDEATGRFVDAISHSPLWGSSLIVVVEDDPGSGGDHVEQHRTICLLASPWLKRGYHSSSMFDLGSVYRTMETMLGVPTMNVYDSHAAAFYELFSTTPDMTPYNYIPRQVPLVTNSADAPLADESNQMDFSQPDRYDLSRVLWKVTHGRDAEPPWLSGPRRRSDPDGD